MSNNERVYEGYMAILAQDTAMMAATRNEKLARWQAQREHEQMIIRARRDALSRREASWYWDAMRATVPFYVTETTETIENRRIKAVMYSLFKALIKNAEANPSGPDAESLRWLVAKAAAMDEARWDKLMLGIFGAAGGPRRHTFLDAAAGNMKMSGTEPKPEIGSRQSVTHTGFPVRALR